MSGSDSRDDDVRPASGDEGERPRRMLPRYALALLVAGLLYALYRCVPS